MLHKGLSISSVKHKYLCKDSAVRMHLFNTLHVQREGEMTATCFYVKPHEPYVICKENVWYKHQAVQVKSQRCTGSMMFLQAVVKA